jgi:hypothetical protein
MEKDEIIQLLKFRIETLEKENKELKDLQIPIRRKEKKITKRRVQNIKNFFIYEEQIKEFIDFLIDEARFKGLKQLLINPKEVIEEINKLTPTDMSVNSCGRIMSHLYPDTKMKVNGVTKYNVLIECNTKASYICKPSSGKSSTKNTNNSDSRPLVISRDVY